MSIQQIIVYSAAFLSIIYCQNLVCNGDFQGHSMFLTYLGELYVYQNSNYSCWYNKDGGQYQVKNKKLPPIGNAAELVLLNPYVLCQNLSLQVGAFYNLSFNTANCQTMDFSTIMVTINNAWVLNVTTINQLNLSGGWVQFRANTTKNKLCFDSVFHIKNMLTYSVFGPYVGNVTVFKVLNAQNSSFNPINSSNSINSTNRAESTLDSTNSTNFTNKTNQTTISNNNSQSRFNQLLPSNILSDVFLIYCSTSTDNVSLDSILFVCTYQSRGAEQIIYAYADQLEIYFENERQKNVKIIEIQPTLMKAAVFPQRAYYLKNIAFDIPKTPFEEFIIQCKFKVQINGASITFSLLSETQKKAAESICPISEIIMQLIQKLYSILRVSFFSYFLIDVINFWNLSLMYNFLNIATVPSFTRNIFEQLEKLLFRLNSIIAWIGSKLPKVQEVLTPNSKTTELMSEFKNGYAWFGYFGMSSDFLTNNTEQVLLLAVLCLKVGLLFCLRKVPFLPRVIKTKIPKGLHLLHMFLHETIGLQIFMVLSSFVVILNTGFRSFDEKINGFGQVLTYFTCIMVIPLFYLVDTELRKREIIKAKIKQYSKKQKSKQGLSQSRITLLSFSNNHAIQTKFGKQSALTSMNSVLEFVPYVLILTMVQLEAPGVFLFVNEVVFAVRCYWLIKFRSSFYATTKEKLFIALNIVIWLTHNSVYVVMWVVQRVIQSEAGDESVINECIKIAGFIAIFTVIAGGGIEILNFLLGLIFNLLNFIIPIFKKCKTRNKNIESRNLQSQTNHSCNFTQINNKSNKISPQFNTNQVIVTMKFVKQTRQILKNKKLQSNQQIMKKHQQKRLRVKFFQNYSGDLQKNIKNWKTQKTQKYFQV